jgi:metal-dependent hydrolase (beta-lactamase superfamily II)
MELKRIYPIHCSGEKFGSFLKESYPWIYGDGKVGLKLISEGNYEIKR